MTRLEGCLKDALPRRLALLDVGARDGVQHPWSALRAAIFQVLVEPEPEEAARLAARLGPEEGTVLPVALWRERGELTLYVTKTRGCSSLYRPNRAFLDQFPESDRFEVEREIRVDTDTVDALAGEGVLPTVDFAKIDVQGAELDILKGGRGHFGAQLVGLEVEVEFCSMYEGQPLFSDVESFVRTALGLEIWDIRKTYWKHRNAIHAGPRKGRLIFGDALFLRPVRGLAAWFEALNPAAAAEKCAMLVAAALAYGYADYAAAVLAAPETRAFLAAEPRQRLEKAARAMGKGLRPFVEGHDRLFLLLDALARTVEPSHRGWATSGRALGSRRRGPFWL